MAEHGDEIPGEIVMPTTEAIDQAFNESWKEADKLRAKYGKDNVYFININRDRILMKNPIRSTFAWDYAVANLSKAEKKEIQKQLREWRSKLPRYPYPELKAVERIVSRHPHAQAYWL